MLDIPPIPPMPPTSSVPAHWNSTLIVLKVQRPITSNDESVPWLFYDESRSIQFEAPESDVAAKFKDAMGDDWKMYINAYIDFNDGRVELLKRLSIQEEPIW